MKLNLYGRVKFFVNIFTLLSTLGTSLYAAENACQNWLSQTKLSPEETRKHILTLTERSMRQAGEKITRLRINKDFETEKKKNFSDLKTKGDCASQEIILTSLKRDKATQEANFLAEEKCRSTSSITESKKVDKQGTWILDPIDGTTTYAHGMPHFSISLAFVADHEICFGAVYAPVHQEFFYAWRGQGAYLKRSEKDKPETIRVSEINQLSSALWITGTEGGPAPAAIDKNRKTFDIALELLPKTHDMRRTGSAALDLAYIASGRAEAYFELSEGLNWWDIAAGILLVEEAGGRTSVLEPVQSSLSEGSHLERPIIYVLASNGSTDIHDSIKALLDKKTSDK